MFLESSSGDSDAVTGKLRFKWQKFYYPNSIRNSSVCIFLPKKINPNPKAPIYFKQFY